MFTFGGLRIYVCLLPRTPCDVHQFTYSVCADIYVHHYAAYAQPHLDRRRCHNAFTSPWFYLRVTTRYAHTALLDVTPPRIPPPPPRYTLGFGIAAPIPLLPLHLRILKLLLPWPRHLHTHGSHALFPYPTCYYWLLYVPWFVTLRSCSHTRSFTRAFCSHTVCTVPFLPHTPPHTGDRAIARRPRLRPTTPLQKRLLSRCMCYLLLRSAYSSALNSSLSWFISHLLYYHGLHGLPLRHHTHTTFYDSCWFSPALV